MKKDGVNSVVKSSTARPIDKLLNESEIAVLGSAANVALALIAGAGAVLLSAAAPNLFKAVGPLLKLKNPHVKYSHSEKQKKTARIFYYLKESGLIQIHGVGKQAKVTLTELGRKKYKKLQEKKINESLGPWEGRWWLIAADIPTRDYRASADAFRSKLRRLNFYPLQRTLWVYPYDPSEIVQEIAQRYRIQNFVTVMEVVGLDREDETKIKSFYGNLKVA